VIKGETFAVSRCRENRDEQKWGKPGARNATKRGKKRIAVNKNGVTLGSPKTPQNENIKKV
jgi:hypothetical protein